MGANIHLCVFEEEVEREKEVKINIYVLERKRENMFLCVTSTRGEGEGESEIKCACIYGHLFLKDRGGGERKRRVCARGYAFIVTYVRFGIEERKEKGMYIYLCIYLNIWEEV